MQFINAPRAGQAGFALTTRGGLLVLESDCNVIVPSLAPVSIAPYHLLSLALSPTDQLYYIARESFPYLYRRCSQYVYSSKEEREGWLGWIEDEVIG